MKSIILISSLVLISGCATTQQDPAVSKGTGSGSSIESQDQPCHLPASSSRYHRHTYDEQAYLSRISYRY
ncbi:hypothetical protein MMIC_P1970 [Mariprofundus micogutta]|uniref:Lipoprotein n=1 Tax=Mariprofundus micogutta TaxID=1921010 RepID=A0A1L8CPZ3_9PROT|nr:hypothetical protein [Mariprofundus micogutta]GAV20991.1 hypothetical protein MMIC_P1970 [Mariprofundus micogutta]